MKHDMIVDGEALRIEAVRGLLRAMDAVGGADAMAQLLGETLHRVTHWREIPVRHVFSVEAATGIPHWEIRPDVDFSGPHLANPWPNEGDWIPEGVDVTRLVGPDRAAADEAVIRAYLDAQHRNYANGSIENADTFVRARDALRTTLGLDRV